MKGEDFVRITVAGLGYVGFSTAVLLAQYHQVTAIDTNEEKVRTLPERIAALAGDERMPRLKQPLQLTATTDAQTAYASAEMVIIAVPTDYDAAQERFDTTCIEAVMDSLVRYQRSAIVVLKSTVPVGYTRRLIALTGYADLLLSPEFLRESTALQDMLYPSRIVIGCDQSNRNLTAQAHRYADLVQQCCAQPAEVLYMNTDEAEAVKLFANTYLALRVAYFNELDTYAAVRGLDAESMIRGVCLDPRIGDHYNNPSFGYGGYCLPKDTRQLLANYREVPECLIHAVVESNATRKRFIAEQVCQRLRAGGKAPADSVVGIFRLTMKSSSDNFRQSSVRDVMELLTREGLRLIVYEPTLGNVTDFEGHPVVQVLADFKEQSDLILANRWEPCLEDVSGKVYSRDIFRRD